MFSIKDMVSDGKQVHFQYYRHRQLWYKTECGFLFPVPIEDTGEATFNQQDKAIFMMRYIRKHIESCKEGQDSQNQ